MSTLSDKKYDVPYDKIFTKKIPYNFGKDEAIISHPITQGKAYVEIIEFEGVRGKYPSYEGLYLIDDNGCNVKAEHFPKIIKELWSLYKQGELNRYGTFMLLQEEREERE